MGCGITKSGHSVVLSSAEGAIGGEVHLCWANGNIETIHVSPKDSINDLKSQLAEKHDVPAAKIKLIQGGTLLSGASAASLVGHTIIAAVTPVTIFQASVSKAKRRGRGFGRPLSYGYAPGTQVVSKLSFEGDDGAVVSEGDIGTVTGPGLPGLDDLTVDFSDVKNVGMRLDQVHLHDPPVISADGARWLSGHVEDDKDDEDKTGIYVGLAQELLPVYNPCGTTRVDFSADWVEKLNQLVENELARESYQVRNEVRKDKRLKVYGINGEDLGLFFTGSGMPELREVPELAAFPLTLRRVA